MWRTQIKCSIAHNKIVFFLIRRGCAVHNNIHSSLDSRLDQERINLVMYLMLYVIAVSNI